MTMLKILLLFLFSIYFSSFSETDKTKSVFFRNYSFDLKNHKCELPLGKYVASKWVANKYVGVLNPDSLLGMKMEIDSTRFLLFGNSISGVNYKIIKYKRDYFLDNRNVDFKGLGISEYDSIFVLTVITPKDSPYAVREVIITKDYLFSEHDGYNYGFKLEHPLLISMNAGDTCKYDFRKKIK